MKTVSFAGQTVTPSKVVCIGRNYVAHIEELGNETPDDMVVFVKPNSALSDILHSQIAEEGLHYESEIAFIVMSGKLAGVGFGLDLTKRDLQSRLKSKGLPWERAKAFDGAALFSEFAQFKGGTNDLSVELEVDDELRQSAPATLMMYSPATILEELGKFMTLEDGDIIMTGTPAGVGEIHTGQRFKGRILKGPATLASCSWVAQ